MLPWIVAGLEFPMFLWLRSVPTMKLELIFCPIWIDLQLSNHKILWSYDLDCNFDNNGCDFACVRTVEIWWSTFCFIVLCLEICGCLSLLYLEYLGFYAEDSSIDAGLLVRKVPWSQGHWIFGRQAAPLCILWTNIYKYLVD